MPEGFRVCCRNQACGRNNDLEKCKITVKYMYNVFEFCVFSHSFLLIISIGLFLLVNICNITCDDIVSNIWSIYMYVLCILGSKRIVWFYIYMYIGGIVEIPALLLITWIYIKYNIHTLYSLSLQIHAHKYCVEHIFKILKLKKKNDMKTHFIHTWI